MKAEQRRKRKLVDEYFSKLPPSDVSHLYRSWQCAQTLDQLADETQESANFYIVRSYTVGIRTGASLIYDTLYRYLRYYRVIKD